MPKDTLTTAFAPATQNLLQAPNLEPENLKMLEAVATALTALPYSRGTIYYFEDFTDEAVMRNSRSLFWESAVLALARCLSKQRELAQVQVKSDLERIDVVNLGTGEPICQFVLDED